jgi:O-antigen/teichoic acid export membrane protein
MKKNLSKYSFIATTVFNSAIGFIKSYLFMAVLNKEQLGYIALFQSVIILIGFLQTGIIHGGYRMISFSIERKKNANNAVMTYLMSLFVIAGACLLVYSVFFKFNWFLITGVAIGLFSLWTNWITNLYIALGRTRLLSIITLVSILISLLGLPLLYVKGVLGAVLLLSIQPIAFIILSFIFNSDFAFKLQKKNIPIIMLCLRYGFIPFFTGILYYLNLQLERFVIGFDLGLKALGEYFLVFVYSAVFLVIPGALATLNFPKMMKSLRSTKIGEFKFFSIFGIYYAELVSYMIFVYLCTYLALPVVIRTFLPAHMVGVHFVKIVFWGLVPFSLIDPISFIINAKLHYKELLYVYIFALTVSVSCYAFLYFNKLGSLINYSYVNVIFFSTVSLGYVIYFFTKGRRTLYLTDK